MRVWALWVVLGIGVFPATARAERLLEPGEIVRDAAEGLHVRKLMVTPSEWASTFAQSFAATAPGTGGRGRINYPQVLSKLWITRDLSLPGLPFLAVRLIPTRRALGGEGPCPFVLKPRLVAADWYGFDLSARF